VNIIPQEDMKVNLTSSWRWLLGLFTFASFVETIFYGQIQAFTPIYLPKLGIPASDVSRWVGIIASVSGLIGLPFLPFWGALADRFARKPVIVRSFTVHALVGAVLVLARNIWAFLLGRSFSGLALGNSGLMMTSLVERAPENRRGLALSIMNSATPVGLFFGPLIGGPVVDRWGFPALMGIDTAILLLVILTMTFGYRDPYNERVNQPLVRMAADSLRILWVNLKLRLLFPALFFLFAGWLLAQTYVPVAVEQLYKGPDVGTVVGLVVGAGGLVTLFASPLLGALGDRFGYWKVLFWSAGLEVLIWPLPALTHTLVAFGIAWAVINGLVSATFSLSFTVLASSTTAEVRGRVMSFSFLPANMGLVVGPAIGSLITRTSVFTVFPAADILTVLGIGLLVWAYKE
jgi:DHA1 family multidrug resistance protein-like MFS transporter